MAKSLNRTSSATRSPWNGSDFENDHGDRRDWKKDRSYRRNKKGGWWTSRQERDFDLDDFPGNSFSALLKRSDQSSGCSDSSLEVGETRWRRHRTKPRVVRQLDEMIAPAAHHCDLTLVNKKYDFQDLSGQVTRFRKKIHIQVRPHVFSGTDQIAVLSFLAKLKDACNISRLSESIALWCFQCYVGGQRETLRLTKLSGSSTAVDSGRSGMFRAYEDILNFLLETDATDLIIAEAYNDVVQFR